MACNSAIASTDRSVVPSPNLSWFWRFPLALLDAITRRRQYNELLELDDRLLADIGVSRTIVAEVRKSSFSGWRDIG